MDTWMFGKKKPMSSKCCLTLAGSLEDLCWIRTSRFKPFLIKVINFTETICFSNASNLVPSCDLHAASPVA